MSDGSAPGGAPAPADTGAAPIDTGAQTPNPVRADPPEQAPKPEPEPKKPEPTSREALRRAQDRVEAGERSGQRPVESRPEPKDKGQDPKADGKAGEAKPEPKQEGANRGQDGRFAPKLGESQQQASQDGRQQAREGEPQGEPKPGDQAGQRPSVQAPARFSVDAKAEWDRAPESVRREVARMERETTEGIERYRADAKEFDSIRDFHQQVTKNGGTLHATLSDVAAMERALIENPIQGLDMVARRMGFSLADVVQRMTGEHVDQRVRETQQAMHALSQENQRLTSIVQAMARETQDRETATATSEIEAFAAGRPRFDELRGTMAGLMRQGLAADLEDAYTMAERLRPGSAAPPAPVPATGSDPAPTPARPAQTRSGTASISGAPAPGSNPAQRPRSSSVKESLRRAAAQAT